MRLPLILVAIAFLPLAAHAYEPGSPEAGEIGRYTFSWSMGEGMLKPRGSSTKGTAVTLDPQPAEEWKRLHETGLSNFERDRRAMPRPDAGSTATVFRPGSALTHGGRCRGANTAWRATSELRTTTSGRAFIEQTLRRSYLAPA